MTEAYGRQIIGNEIEKMEATIAELRASTTLLIRDNAAQIKQLEAAQRERDDLERNQEYIRQITQIEVFGAQKELQAERTRREEAVTGWQQAALGAWWLVQGKEEAERKLAHIESLRQNIGIQKALERAEEAEDLQMRTKNGLDMQIQATHRAKKRAEEAERERDAFRDWLAQAQEQRDTAERRLSEALVALENWWKGQHNHALPSIGQCAPCEALLDVARAVLAEKEEK